MLGVKRSKTFATGELPVANSAVQDKLLAFEVKDFLHEYLNDALFQEIESVNLRKKILEIKIKSPLLKSDFRMRKTFFLNKFKEQFPDADFSDLQIL